MFIDKTEVLNGAEPKEVKIVSVKSTKNSGISKKIDAKIKKLKGNNLFTQTSYLNKWLYTLKIQ